VQYRVEIEVDLFTTLLPTEIIVPLLIDGLVDLQEADAVDIVIVFDALVSEVALPNITLTAIPDTMPEGTVILPSITLTITPSTILEGN
jgi:hypothetical protein